MEARSEAPTFRPTCARQGFWRDAAHACKEGSSCLWHVPARSARTSLKGSEAAVVPACSLASMVPRAGGFLPSLDDVTLQLQAFSSPTDWVSSSLCDKFAKRGFLQCTAELGMMFSLHAFSSLAARGARRHLLLGMAAAAVYAALDQGIPKKAIAELRTA